MRWPRWTKGKHRPAKPEPTCHDCGHPETDHYLNDSCYGTGRHISEFLGCKCLTPFPGMERTAPYPLVETWESCRTL